MAVATADAADNPQATPQRALGVQVGAGLGVVLVTLCLLPPHHRVAVVLVAPDQHVLAGVDAHNLLLVCVEGDMALGAEGDLGSGEREKERDSLS